MSMRYPLKTRAKYLAIAMAIICVLVFPFTLPPAFVSVYAFEIHGSGVRHELKIWGIFLILLLMPLVTLAGILMPVISYWRGRHGLVIKWCLGTLLLLVIWAPLAWPVY